MKRASALADRTALLSLRALAALNLLVFLSFMLVAFLAAGKAHAEAPACSGRDLLIELQKSDPVAYRKVEADAAATLNGQGLLWKVEKEGAEPSFLFGTMHMTDPRVTTLTPAAQRAFDGAATVVIETTDVLDQQTMMGALFKEPELMMFTDGTTLSSLLSPEDAAVMNAALEERGIPPASVARMKPWILSSMVAIPACEFARKASGAEVLDVKLGNEAKRRNKELLGLETAGDQLGAMASLPIAFHMKGLVETLRMGDRMIADMAETMIGLYARGSVGAIWPMLRAAMPPEADDPEGYAAFEETMIKSRNRTMAERSMPILARGKAFIAVGALHLPGPEGLIEDFRKGGYTVTRQD